MAEPEQAKLNVDKLLDAFVSEAAAEWPDELENAARRIEELGPLPSDEEILAVVHAFVERLPGALRAVAQERSL